MQTTQLPNSIELSKLNDPTREAIESMNTDSVGRAFHESLLLSLINGDMPEPHIFGITDKSIMHASVNYPSHEERREAARDAGRMFSHEAVEKGEKLNFIGITTVGVNREDGSEMAITFVHGIHPLHKAETKEQYMELFPETDILMFIDELKDGRIADTVYDGIQCLSQKLYDELPEEEREGKTVATNALLIETFIGSSYAFEFLRNTAE